MNNEQIRLKMLLIMDMVMHSIYLFFLAKQLDKHSDTHTYIEGFFYVGSYEK